MGQTLTPLGVRGRQQQATAFHLRENTRERRLPALGLDGTHRYTSADNPIDTDVVFPDTLLPITIRCRLSRPGASNPLGIVCEWGGGGAGGGIYMNGGNVGVFAGSNNAVTGCHIEVGGVIPPTSAGLVQYDIVGAWIPGTGVAALWVNGTLRGAAQSVDGDFGLVGWAGSDDGAIADVAGSVNSRIPAPAQVALVNVDLIGPVQVYYNQRPRAFPVGGIGTDGGGGSWTN